MGRIVIPAVHLPHGREVFKTLPWRPSRFKKVLKAFSERGLLQCSPEDILVLAQRTEERYLRFLVERGIGTEKIILCAGEGDNLAQDILDSPAVLESLRDGGLASARFYIHLEEEDAIARAIGQGGATTHPVLTRMFNTIYFLVRLEEDLDLPSLPRTQVRSSRIEGPLLKMLEEGGKLFVRGNESCGGSQTYPVENSGDVAAIRKRVASNRVITRYFVSPFLPVEESWNVQYEIGEEGTCSLFGASLQELEGGYAHKGNVGGRVPPDGVLSAAETLVKRLSEMGGKGMVGLDLLVSGGKVHVCEINARENTSTPVIALQRRIKAEFFRTLKVHVPRFFTFSDFERKVGTDTLLDPDRRSGVLPYHLRASELTETLDVAVYSRSEQELERISGGILNAF